MLCVLTRRVRVSTWLCIGTLWTDRWTWSTSKCSNECTQTTRALTHTQTQIASSQQFRTQRNQVDVKTNQAQTTAFSDRHTCFTMALYRRMISCTKYSLPERLNWPYALSNKWNISLSGIVSLTVLQHFLNSAGFICAFANASGNASSRAVRPHSRHLLEMRAGTDISTRSLDT